MPKRKSRDAPPAAAARRPTIAAAAEEDSEDDGLRPGADVNTRRREARAANADLVDATPVRGRVAWREVKEAVLFLLKDACYADVLRHVRRAAPELRHGDGAITPTVREAYLVATLYHDSEQISYVGLAESLDLGVPVSPATLRHNAHALRRALAEWSDALVMPGTLREWREACERRQLFGLQPDRPLLVMDIREFPLGMTDGRSPYRTAQQLTDLRAALIADPTRGAIRWVAAKFPDGGKRPGPGPALRWLVVTDLHHTVRFLHGPVAPTTSAAALLASGVGDTLDRLFAGATLIADADFSGIRLERCHIDAPVHKRAPPQHRRRRRDEEEGESDDSSMTGLPEFDLGKQAEEEATHIRCGAPLTRLPQPGAPAPPPPPPVAAAAAAPVAPPLPPRVRQNIFFRDVGRLYAWWARWPTLTFGHAPLAVSEGPEQHAFLVRYTAGIFNFNNRL